MHNIFYNSFLKLIEDSLKLVPSRQTYIGVSGFCGSGKSTLCNKIKNTHTGNIIIFEMDWFSIYSSKERQIKISEAFKSNQIELLSELKEPINWFDWELIINTLEKFKKTGELLIENAWNQLSGEKDLQIKYHIDLKTNHIILCDGIYFLHPRIRKMLDIITILNTPLEVSLNCAFLRDKHRSTEQYLEYKKILFREHDLSYFKNYTKESDLIFNMEYNHENPPARQKITFTDL